MARVLKVIRSAREAGPGFAASASLEDVELFLTHDFEEKRLAQIKSGFLASHTSVFGLSFFKKFVNLNQPQITDQQIEAEFKAADADNDGRLDEDQISVLGYWTKFWWNIPNETKLTFLKWSEFEIRKACHNFLLLDKQQTGRLTTPELLLYLSRYEIELGAVPDEFERGLYPIGWTRLHDVLIRPGLARIPKLNPEMLAKYTKAYEDHKDAKKDQISCAETTAYLRSIWKIWGDDIEVLMPIEHDIDVDGYITKEQFLMVMKVLEYGMGVFIARNCFGRDCAGSGCLIT